MIFIPARFLQLDLPVQRQIGAVVDRLGVHRHDGRRVRVAGDGGLVFDGKPVVWECVDRLRKEVAPNFFAISVECNWTAGMVIALACRDG